MDPIVKVPTRSVGFALTILDNALKLADMKVKNLWAPWRMEYIDLLADEDEGCFLCRAAETPGDDEANHVLWRTEHVLAIMNRFPYNNGHFLIAPLTHKAELADLSDAEMLGIWRLAADLQTLQREEMKAHGFNLGVNIGRCAGAGLPGHIHLHVVPRWRGDTNFMPVVGQAKVIPQALDGLYRQLRKASVRMGLPR